MIVKVIFTFLYVSGVLAFLPLKDILSDDQIEACRTEAGFTKDDLPAPGKHKPPVMNAEHKLKHDCFMKCAWSAAEILDQDGNIDADKLEETMSGHGPEDHLKTVKECASKSGAIKSCEDMGKLHSCFPRPPKPPSDH